MSQRNNKIYYIQEYMNRKKNQMLLFESNLTKTIQIYDIMKILSNEQFIEKFEIFLKYIQQVEIKNECLKSSGVQTELEIEYRNKSDKSTFSDGYKEKYEELLMKYKELLIKTEKGKEENNILNEKIQKLVDLTHKLEKDIEEKKKYICVLEENVLSKNKIKSVKELTTTNKFYDVLEVKKIHVITKYLHSIETFNLKHTSKKFYLAMDTNPIILKQILLKTIKNKNSIINDIQSSINEDVFIEYHNKNIEIENLIKKHTGFPTLDKDIYKPIKELGDVIMKAIEFINGEVKSDPRIKFKKQDKGILGGM